MVPPFFSCPGKQTAAGISLMLRGMQKNYGVILADCCLRRSTDRARCRANQQHRCRLWAPVSQSEPGAYLHRLSLIDIRLPC